MMKNYDIIIVGAGITGLALARALVARGTQTSILLLEQESGLGRHGSGRNSGVLHSGIYYPEGSLKGRLCAEGGRRMGRYCEERNLPIKRLGKVVVPREVDHDATLDMLLSRAKSNGATAELIDKKQLKELEPFAHTASGRALWSPNTAVVDPHSVLDNLQKELSDAGVHFWFGEGFKQVDVKNRCITTTKGTKVSYGRCINAAGQFAETVAQSFGVGREYVSVPFKGIYYKLAPNSHISFQRLIYPVPDLNVPFLGVHTVNDMGGNCYFGPTAVPALSKTHYNGLKGIKVGEMSSILYYLGRLYCRNPNHFRRHCHTESFRFLKSSFIKAAKQIVPEITKQDLVACSKRGIRPQLVNRKTLELEMDFIVEACAESDSVHVLNAISPAWTSAFAFADYILNEHFDKG